MDEELRREEVDRKAMSPSTRFGYAFAFSIAASALTLPVFLFISWDVVNSYMESNYSLVVPAMALVIGYLGAPMVHHRFKLFRAKNSRPRRGFVSRAAYSFALSLIISGLVVGVLALVSKAAAHTFFEDNYFAAVFLIAFFVIVPVLDRFRRLRQSERAE